MTVTIGLKIKVDKLVEELMLNNNKILWEM